MKQRALTERDLRSLRVFCAVVEAGGFAAAEDRLHLSKASISRHIRDVEEHLGVRLCDRGPSGFKLTDAGFVAVDLATHALRSLDHIKAEIDAVRGVTSGTLTIGMAENLMADPKCAVVDALSELARRAPGIRPQVSITTFSNLNQALRERKLDIAIRGMYQRERFFNYQPLFTEYQRVYAISNGSAKAPRNLPLAIRPHPYVERALNEHHFKRGAEASSLEAVLMLVGTGNYCGILPEAYAAMAGKRYPLQVVPGSPSFRNVVCAITEASRPMTARTMLFLEILKELHAQPAQA